MPFIADEVLKKVQSGPRMTIRKIGAENKPGPTHGFLPGSESASPGEGRNPSRPVTIRDFAPIPVEQDVEGKPVRQRNFERNPMLSKKRNPQ